MNKGRKEKGEGVGCLRPSPCVETNEYQVTEIKKLFKSFARWGRLKDFNSFHKSFTRWGKIYGILALVEQGTLEGKENFLT